MCTSWALGVESLQVERPTTLIVLKLQIASNADGSNLTRLCLVGRAKVEIRFRKAGKGSPDQRSIHPSMESSERLLRRASSAESRGGDTPKARSGPWQLALRQTRRTAWLRSWNGGHQPPKSSSINQVRSTSGRGCCRRRYSLRMHVTSAPKRLRSLLAFEESRRWVVWTECSVHVALRR